MSVSSNGRKRFPAVVEAADAMVKAARVTLVGYEKIGSGRDADRPGMSRGASLSSGRG